MTTFTFGPLALTTFELSTSLSLEELRTAMRRRRYKDEIPSRGWAGVDWSADNEAAPVVDRTAPGSPDLVQMRLEGSTPVLLGRHVRDVLRDGGPRVLPELTGGVLAENRYEQRMIDVMIVASEVDGVFIVIVPTHDSAELTLIRKYLKALDPDEAQLEEVVFYSEKERGSFFLWLAVHDLEDENVTPHISIKDFREISSTTPSGKRTRASEGVSFSALFSLAVIAEGHELGPVKVVVEDRQHGILPDIQLLNDGTVTVHKTNSMFDEGPLKRGEKGLRLCHYVATSLVPAMVEAFQSDKTWTAERMLEIRMSTIDTMETILKEHRKTLS